MRVSTMVWVGPATYLDVDEDFHAIFESIVELDGDSFAKLDKPSTIEAFRNRLATQQGIHAKPGEHVPADKCLPISGEKKTVASV